MYEVALNIEGYQSSGTADVYKNVIHIGGSSQPGGGQSSGGSSGGDTTIQCEDMTIGGPYAGKISSPFSGVALYGNSDEVSCTQDFGYDTHDFTLRGASSNNNMARVDLMIGGENKGTFYFGDAYTAEYTIKNVRHKTGQQKIELIVNADDGNWDAYIDSLAISGAGGTAAVDQSGEQDGQTNPGTSIAGRKVAALTFDDGPTSTTNDVLDVLARYDVPATFFLIGQQVNSSTMATMQREVSMGCELACHSYTHQDMSKMSANQIRN